MYTACGKQVLRDGEDFAQACDPGAAVLIADTLNDRGRWVIPPDYDADAPPSRIIEIVPYTGPTRVQGTMHTTRREGDEYACSCGARWDVTDSEAHP